MSPDDYLIFYHPIEDVLWKSKTIHQRVMLVDRTSKDWWKKLKHVWYLTLDKGMMSHGLRLYDDNLEQISIHREHRIAEWCFPNFKAKYDYELGITLTRIHVKLPDYGIEEPLIYADKLEENGFEEQATRIRKAWYNADVIDLCRVLGKDVFHKYAAFDGYDLSQKLVVYTHSKEAKFPSHIRVVSL